jgi:hypothetical protein
MIKHSTNILEMTNMLFTSFRFIHLCMFELNMSLMESQSAAIVFRDFVKVMVYPNRWRLWKSCFVWSRLLYHYYYVISYKMSDITD